MATDTPASDKRAHLEEIRDEDLEPYVTLRYIARLFKVLAILMVVLMLGEVITGLVADGMAALLTVIGEGTKLIVIAGLMWAGGDITLLLIDAGHDVRVARILLGRINSKLHGTGTGTITPRAGAAPAATTPAPPQSRG